jgi:hypothetical protein
LLAQAGGVVAFDPAAGQLILAWGLAVQGLSLGPGKAKGRRCRRPLESIAFSYPQSAG